MTAVLGFNLLGDALRDRLDPRIVGSLSRSVSERGAAPGRRASVWLPSGGKALGSSTGSTSRSARGSSSASRARAAAGRRSRASRSSACSRTRVATAAARSSTAGTSSRSRKELRQVRGAEIGMVFQDPMVSLHPMLTVGPQLTDHVQAHLRSAHEAGHELRGCFAPSASPTPNRTLRAYPYELSGGMRQRIAIAIAIACHPKLLIADEPTTALDVTVQAGILALLVTLADEHGLAVIFITHDLGVMPRSLTGCRVRRSCGRERHRRGRPRPRRATRTRGALLDSRPGEPIRRRPRLSSRISGPPPVRGSFPSGCRFHPRCRYAGSAVPPSSPQRRHRARPRTRLVC